MSKSITSPRSFLRERLGKRPFGFEERPFVSFPIQRVDIDWDRLIDQVGGEPPFKIGRHTFRHSFAVHLLLHGRPLKFVSQLLGHRSVESTEVYANVLTFDGAHFLEGVELH